MGSAMLQYPFSGHSSYEAPQGAIQSTYSLSKLHVMRMRKIFVYESSSNESRVARLSNKFSQASTSTTLN